MEKMPLKKKSGLIVHFPRLCDGDRPTWAVTEAQLEVAAGSAHPLTHDTTRGWKLVWLCFSLFKIILAQRHKQVDTP